MTRRPLLPVLLAALALAAPGAGRGAEGGAIGQAAEELAARLAEGTPPDRVAVATVAPGAEGLADPFTAALCAALSRRGFAPVPLRGRELTEATARAAGADRLARVRLALGGGGRELAAAAEVWPLRESFFLQRTPAAPGARLLAISVPADAAARALGRPAGPPRLAAPALVPLFTLPERVLALAVLPAGDGAALVVATPAGLLVLSSGGQRLAARPAPPLPPGIAVRQPAAALAVGDFGGGRIAWQPAGAPEAEVLELGGGRLSKVATLAAAPLAAGGGGRLFGAFAPGLPVFLDRVSTAVEPGAPRSARLLQGACAAPRPGRAAFALLHADDSAEILDGALAPVGRRVEGVGAGFALADLDGDGEPDLVASSAEPGPEDRVRVSRLAPAAETVFQSQPVPGAILAAAAGDLSGDGVDDVVLAAVQPGGETRLWLLTADPREGGR